MRIVFACLVAVVSVLGARAACAMPAELLAAVVAPVSDVHRGVVIVVERPRPIWPAFGTLTGIGAVVAVVMMGLRRRRRDHVPRY